MKRRKIIKASDRSVRVRIEITIDTSPGYFVRQEVNGMTENLASAIMRQISDTRHLEMPLSQIKVH